MLDSTGAPCAVCCSSNCTVTVYCHLQVKSGTIFDNVLITDDEEYASEFAKETWEKTKDPEKKMKDQVRMSEVVE